MFWLTRVAIVLVLSLLIPKHSFSVELIITDPIIIDNNVTLTASLSGTANNNYLQGVLRAIGASKYFGETQNKAGTWIDYISSPEKEYINSSFYVTELQEASWSGQINIRYKVDDPLYQGPGNYELKLRRFTGGSSGPAGESNTLVVVLTKPTPTPTPSPTPPASATAPATSTPTPTPTSTPSPTISPTQSPIQVVPSPEPEEVRIATVAGLNTSLPKASPFPNMDPRGPSPRLSPARLRVVFGIGAGLLSLACAIYFALRKSSIASIIKE